MTAKIIHKTFASKASDDPLEYVMSDGSVDRMGDVIEPSGWDLKEFAPDRNPIALFNHNKDFIVGNWENVRVEKGALRGKLSLLDPVSDRLREIHAAVKGGVLRAVSVGFSAIEAEPLKDSKKMGVHFLKQSLVECSLVAVGANTNALQIAKSLNLSDETMSTIFKPDAVVPLPDSKSIPVVREMEVVQIDPDADYSWQETKDRVINEWGMLNTATSDMLKLRSPDEWSPAQAKEAKQWLAKLMKDYPFNPLYRKLHRLMDEIETVRTLKTIVRAKIGKS